jgi:hypothetical protein
LWLTQASAFTIASKLAASATFSIVAVLSMRFIKLLKAEPGPSSQIVYAFASAMTEFF